MNSLKKTIERLDNELCNADTETERRAALHHLNEIHAACIRQKRAENATKNQTLFLVKNKKSLDNGEEKIYGV